MIPESVAKEVRDMVASAWRDYTDTNGTVPTLNAHDHEGQPEGHWSIAWEGGPDEWPIVVAEGWSGPQGVGYEARTSVILGLYPEH